MMDPYVNYVIQSPIDTQSSCNKVYAQVCGPRETRYIISSKTMSPFLQIVLRPNADGGSIPFLDNSQAHADVGSLVTEKGLE